MSQYFILVLTGENGNAARRRDGQEHGGLVLAVLLGDARLVVVEHWDEPRRDELARLPAYAQTSAYDIVSIRRRCILCETQVLLQHQTHTLLQLARSARTSESGGCR